MPIIKCRLEHFVLVFGNWQEPQCIIHFIHKNATSFKLAASNHTITHMLLLLLLLLLLILSLLLLLLLLLLSILFLLLTATATIATDSAQGEMGILINYNLLLALTLIFDLFLCSFRTSPIFQIQKQPSTVILDGGYNTHFCPALSLIDGNISDLIFLKL